MMDARIVLSFLWVALMLVYLLGDVLRIFSGDFVPGEIEGKKVNKNVYFGLAVFMLVPILMILLSLALPHELNRLFNIIVSVILFGFNLFGLPTYPSLYDKFLIVVGLIFNVITIVYAWNWLQ